MQSPCITSISGCRRRRQCRTTPVCNSRQGSENSCRTSRRHRNGRAVVRPFAGAPLGYRIQGHWTAQNDQTHSLKGNRCTLSVRRVARNNRQAAGQGVCVSNLSQSIDRRHNIVGPIFGGPHHKEQIQSIQSPNISRLDPQLYIYKGPLFFTVNYIDPIARSKATLAIW